MGKNFEGIKRQRFGVELEMTGLTRAEAARAVADYFGSEPSHWGGAYDRYVISDDQCREWKIMSDGSIDCQTHNGRSAWLSL